MVSLFSGGEGGSESQQTSGSGTRQLKPLDRILRWFALLAGWLLTVCRRLQVQKERRAIQTHERINEWKDLKSLVLKSGQ